MTVVGYTVRKKTDRRVDKPNGKHHTEVNSVPRKPVECQWFRASMKAGWRLETGCFSEDSLSAPSDGAAARPSVNAR